jgi:hypothetical protein
MAPFLRTQSISIFGRRRAAQVTQLLPPGALLQFSGKPTKYLH